jgi:hypothetical protein
MQSFASFSVHSNLWSSEFFPIPLEFISLRRSNPNAGDDKSGCLVNVNLLLECIIEKHALDIVVMDLLVLMSG